MLNALCTFVGDFLTSWGQDNPYTLTLFFSIITVIGVPQIAMIGRDDNKVKNKRV